MQRAVHAVLGDKAGANFRVGLAEDIDAAFGVGLQNVAIAACLFDELVRGDARYSPPRPGTSYCEHSRPKGVAALGAVAEELAATGCGVALGGRCCAKAVAALHRSEWIVVQ